MNIQILSYILLTGLAFGSSLIAARFGIRQIDPYLYTGLRMGMASLGGVLLLDEKITAGMLIGMGVIILGILLINYRGPIYARLNKELETL